jgi:hypothetical protein
MVDETEQRVEVLLKQEASHYLTCDYLSSTTTRTHHSDTLLAGNGEASVPNSKKRKSPSYFEDKNRQEVAPPLRVVVGIVPPSEHGGSAESQIKKQWREKICEWAYQGKEMTREPAHARILMHLTRHGSFISDCCSC